MSRRLRAFAHGREVELTPTLQAAARAAADTARRGPVRLLVLPELGEVAEPDTGRTWSVATERFVELVVENLPACYHRDWRLIRTEPRP